jgi:hypothetical protein
MPHSLKSICFVAVLSVDPAEGAEIAGAVRGFGASCEIAPSVARLREILIGTPCNGLLLSVRSAVRVDAAGKQLIRSLEHAFPAARIKRRPSDASFAVMPSQGSSARSLPDFIASCAAFEARRIRKYERIAKTLNTLLSDSPDADEPEQTFSFDLSTGGALLHSVREWRVGEKLFLSFRELPWPEPVEAEVRHLFPWGIPFHPRSIGVRFTGMAPAHAENLNVLIYGKKG